MLKVTIKFNVRLFICCFICTGCGHVKNDKDRETAMRRSDSMSEARIDSAYRTITQNCDTSRVHLVPRFVVALMKGDSLCMDRFFDNEIPYIDSNKKVEKVVRQLQMDCDSDLRRVTINKVRLLKKKKKNPTNVH